MTSSLLGSESRKNLLDSTRAERDMNSVTLEAKDLLEKEISQGKIQLLKVAICVCGSENLEPLSSVDRFGLNFGSLICVDCGLVLTNPRIAEQSLPDYYDKIYHPLNFGKTNLDELPFLFGEDQGRKIFNLTCDLHNSRNKLRILEIGFGTGSVLREFIDNSRQFGFADVEAIGTEYSEECMTIAKNRNKGRNIAYMYGGLQEVAELDSGKFNLIILSHVFEHFVSLDVELARIAELLAPDGLLYIEVPGIFQIHKARQYNFSFLGYMIHAHMYNFTAASLANIVCSNGYQVNYINENIEAVFRKSSQHVRQYSYSSSYRDIVFYLELIHRDQEYFKSQVETEKALRADKSKAQRAAHKKQLDINEKTKTIQSLNQTNQSLNQINQSLNETNENLIGTVNLLSGQLEKLRGFLPIRLALKVYRWLPKRS